MVGMKPSSMLDFRVKCQFLVQGSEKWSYKVDEAAVEGSDTVNVFSQDGAVEDLFNTLL